MEKMIARCGLDCGPCPARTATLNNDEALRQKVAADWSAQYHAVIRPEDVVCDGCTSEGRHFGYCNMCEIRKCANGRNVANCGVCPDYGCERSAGFWTMAPQAKANLEALRGA